MPKDTFSNLPQQKRQHLLETAIDEFYQFGYDGFSISSFVKEAGIAKGSFYQYFEDKNDLFRLIIDLVSQKKVLYFEKILKKAGLTDSKNKNDFEKDFENDFFEILKALYLASFDFHKEHPKLSSIGDSFDRSATEKDKHDVFGVYVDQSNSFLMKLVLDGIKSKQIREDIDAEFLVHMISHISLTMGEFVKRKFESVESVDKSVYTEYVEKTISILRKGTGTQAGTGDGSVSD